MGSPTTNNIGAYIKGKRALSPQAVSGSSAVNGATLDRTGYGSCKVIATSGANTGTPTSINHDVKVQESDDGSTWADVTGASGKLAAADSELEISVDLQMRKKNIRAVVTPAFTGGTSPTTQVAVSIALGGSDKLPA